ncbi:MAG: LytR C-terminal domain-containing protein [Candidatus Eisenbacteria bacterium]
MIVGVVGLQILDDSESGSGSGASSTVTTSGVTTTVAVRSPAQVRVKVYNASGVLGVAQTTTDTLKAKGYNVQAPDTVKTKRTGTGVQCRPGFEREATELANSIGSGAKKEAFPSSPPAGADSADCLVIIGT